MRNFVTWRGGLISLALLALSCASSRPASEAPIPIGTRSAAPAVESAPAPAASRPSCCITRAELSAVESAGPGVLLSRLRLVPKRDGSALVGYELAAAEPGIPLYRCGVDLGFVVTRVNARFVKKPGDLMAIWATLSSVDSLVVEGLNKKGDESFTLVVADHAPCP